MSYQYWLIATVVLVILEILPPPTHFFFVCLAFGTLGGAIAAVFTHSAWIPWLVFSVLSVALTPILIPLAKFLFPPTFHPSHSNAIVGQRAKVLEPVDPTQAGAIQWGERAIRAVSESGRFERGEWILIEKVEENSVVIKQIA